MPYSKTDWIDGSTPANAANLDKIEAGIETATQLAEAAQPLAQKAQANGYASLGADGKVPSSQLFPVPAMLVTMTSNLVTTAWPDAAQNSVDVLAHVPAGGKDVNFKFLRRATGSGVAVMQRTVYRFRPGAALVTLESNVPVNINADAGTSQLLTVAVAAASYQAGDSLRVTITRLGADVGDTYAGHVQLDGALVEYV